MKNLDKYYDYCIASSGIVPLRKEASDASEMVSQIILGETATVREVKDRWIRIECHFDRYIGWVNRNQICFLKKDEYESWTRNPERYRSPYVTFFADDQNKAIMIPVSAFIIKDGNQIRLPFGTFRIRTRPNLLKQKNLLDTAFHFSGTPYLWGGRTETGIDCSGFIQTVHLLHGYVIPRDSKDQYKAVEIKSHDIKDARKGDIIYFNTTGRNVNHVGFYLGDGGVIHASGNVRLSNVLYERRNDHLYTFDKRLADHICGVQSGSLLRKFAIPVQIE